MKKILIKYECEKCGHVEKAKVKEQLLFAFRSIFAIYGFFALCFFLYILIMPVYVVTNNLGSIASMYYTTQSARPDSQLKLYTSQIAKGCDADSRCVTQKLFNNVSGYLQYGYGAAENCVVYDPKFTLKIGEGDCKNMAYTFSAMLHQEGVNAKVMCNKCHCWNIVAYKDTTAVIDLTDSSYAEYVPENLQQAIKDFDKMCK